MMKFPRRLLFFLIIGVALFLRIYRVASSPHDLNVDEVAIGWNAYSILKTGRDEYGYFLPISFKSFGDYKLPLYIYTTTISEALFGKNAFAVRLPSVLAGTFTVLVFIYLIELLTHSSKLTYLSGVLLAISPWHLQFSRAGFEANFAFFWLILGIYLVLLDLEKKQKTFFLGILSFILSLYSYHSERLITPLLFLGIGMIYRSQLKSIMKRKRSLLYILLLGLMSLPYFWYAFSPQGLARAGGESLINDYHAANSEVLPKMVWIVNRYLENYLTYFSVIFHFFAGDTIGRHSVREIGMNYLWQLPFALAGIVQLVKQNRTDGKIFFWWGLVSPVAASFAGVNPHALRTLPFVIPMTYVSAVGLDFVMKKIRSHQTIFAVGLTFVALYFFVQYLHIYYIHYPERTSPDWAGGIKQAIEFAHGQEIHYDKIALSDTIALGYIYLYFYGDFKPEEIYKSPDPHHKLGKYEFVLHPYLPPKNIRSLYIAESHIPSEGKKIYTVINRGGDETFYIWEN